MTLVSQVRVDPRVLQFLAFPLLPLHLTQQLGRRMPI